MKKISSISSIAAAIAIIAASLTAGAQVTFNYTGSVQTYTVPSGITNLCIDANGASGGNAINGSLMDSAGRGGRVECNLAVTPGQVLSIYVGGRGTDGGFVMGVAGGYNGGGSTGFYYGGSGGGATDIRTGGTAMADRVIVAGGGGGGGLGMVPTFNYERGGGGGDVVGENGYYSNANTGVQGGHGGTATAGGVGGVLSGFGSAGSLGTGGASNSSSYAGAGGGGYYGGGGGSFSGGGGGSSYCDATFTSYITHTQGYNLGNGSVIITPGGCLAMIMGPSTVTVGSTITLTEAVSGGLWSSGSPAVATVVAGTGVVTGVAVGTAVISYSAGSAVVTKTVTVSASTTGVAIQSSVKGAAIYPNPAGDVLTLQVENGMYASYSITNSIGQEMGHGNITTGNTAINTSAYAPGVYQLMLKGASGTSVQKFIKQ